MMPEGSFSNATNFFKDYISEIPFKKISDGSIVDLNSVENNGLETFINFLLDGSSGQPIFRGEKFCHAFKKYINTEHEKIDKFVSHCNSVFYMGNKSKAYLYSTHEEGRLDFNDISPGGFEKIYNKLIDSDAFVDQALQESNQNDFVDKIMTLNDDDRCQAKKYYTWFLHVNDVSSFNETSYFLSTSIDFNVANQFGDHQLLYCGWVPQPLRANAVSCSDLFQIGNRLEEAGLWKFQDEPYPEEHELSLLNGLFPHYTLGIYNVPDEIIIINTHLIKAIREPVTNNSAKKIITDGIMIDQFDFSNREIVKNSGYKSIVTKTEEGEFQDSDL